MSHSHEDILVEVDLDGRAAIIPQGFLTDYQTHGRLRPCRSKRKSLT